MPHGFPKISGKSRPIYLRLGALFRTLIADADSPFSASRRPSSRGADFYTKSGQSSAAISSRTRGYLGDTLFAHDFPKILEKSWALYRRLGVPDFEPQSRLRIPHFRHHFGPPPDALIFTHNLGNHQPRLAHKRRHPVGTWIVQDFLKFRKNRGQSITSCGGWGPYFEP